jgi:hypothetical protein
MGTINFSKVLANLPVNHVSGCLYDGHPTIRRRRIMTEDDCVPREASMAYKSLCSLEDENSYTTVVDDLDVAAL